MSNPPVSPNTNIDESRKAIEKILVKHHLPEKAPGEKLWGEYIDVVLDLEAILSTAKEQGYKEGYDDRTLEADHELEEALKELKEKQV